MIRYEGFDPLSPTLRYSECFGSCMGPQFERATVWYDETLPVRSGDLVRVGLRDRNGHLVYIVKRLECDRAGFWYLVATAHGVTALMMLTGNFVSVARIVGHAQRTADHMTAPSIADIEADEREYELNELFSRHAREEWRALGHVRDGSVFPGIEGVQARGYPPEARAEEASSTTIPPTNPTAPTEPQSFTVQSLAGTLYFDWNSPTVKPMGTRYQLIRSPGSASAVQSGQIIWDGEADNALVGADSVTSPYWYHVRAYAGSYYSAYSPNTVGLLGVPAFAPNVAGRTVPDPQFRSGISANSWWWVAGGWPNPWGSLSPSGGLSSDAGRFIVVGTTSLVTISLQADRRSLNGYRPLSGGSPAAFEVVPGQWLSWSTAFRRRTSLAGGGTGVGFHVTLLAENGASQVSLVNSSDGYCRCDTLSVDQWTFRTGSAQVPNSTWIVAYGALQFFGGDVNSGTIEVGAFDVVVS